MSAQQSNDNTTEALRGKLDELMRIRQGFAAHLGASLYEATRENMALRNGREQLYDGIALCDEQIDGVRRRIADLEARAAQGQAAPADVCPRCGSPIEASHKFCMNCGLKLGDE